jgi:hypothetical protein
MHAVRCLPAPVCDQSLQVFLGEDFEHSTTALSVALESWSWERLPVICPNIERARAANHALGARGCEFGADKLDHVLDLEAVREHQRPATAIAA